MWKYIRSRTVWGGALYGAAQVLADPSNPEGWLAGLGSLIAAVGVKGAIEKKAAKPGAAS